MAILACKLYVQCTYRIEVPMFKFTKDRISVMTVLDKRRPKASGLYPVKVQVVYRRVQKYYLTGKELTEEEWQKLPETKSRRLLEIRESIENSFSLVKYNVEALAEKGGFSFDALNIRLGKATGDTVNSAFKAKIENLKKEGRIGTMEWYENIYLWVEKFGGNKISFDTITIDWLKRYERFLLKDKNHTTVGMHMRAIRAIMNEAKKAGVIKDSQYPFGKDKYEIQAGAGRKKALTLQEIGKIVRFSNGNETTERYRDLWFFMYLCNGINTADLVKLKYKNIHDGEICFVRQKTERTNRTIKEICVPITPEMETIIKRWGNEPLPDNLIFPYLEGVDDPIKHKHLTKDLTRRINKRMKRMGQALGIENITTYTARHSFATVLKRSGANISYISESLGHSDLKTTEAYLASFEKEERQKNARLLTKFDN